MNEKLTIEEWQRRYKPIKNPVEPAYADTFPIHDEGYELVTKAISETPNKVWTQYAYGGRTCISAGAPNNSGTAIMCYITEVPWEDENIQTQDYEI